MISELPVESVNGQSEWDWNERRTARKPSNPPDRSVNSHSARTRGGPADRTRVSRREVERLEAELEQKEQQLRHVTEQYELLLAEKNRQLTARDDSGSESDLEAALRSIISRYLVGRS